LSVVTGEILDYKVKSLICHECRTYEQNDKDSDVHKAWKENHQATCQINHSVSSEEMEASAAVQIPVRSISNLQLKYTTFVGDGVSSSFGKLQEAMKATFGGKYVVEKGESVRHVQKRMGTAGTQ